MKKFFIRFFIIIVILVITVVTLLRADIWDIDLPDMSDLEINYVEVPSENNAYTYLKQAGETLKMTDDEYEKVENVLYTNEKDDEFCLTLLEKNKPVIALIKRAVECKFLHFPKADTYKQSLTNNESIGELISLNHLLNLRARFSFDDNLHLDFVRLITKMQNTTELGIIFCGISLKQTLRNLSIQFRKMNSTQISQAASALCDISQRDIKSLYISALKFENYNFSQVTNVFENGDSEYVTLAELLDTCNSNSGFHGWHYLLQFNRSKLLYAKVIRGYIKGINKSIYEENDYIHEMIKTFPIAYLRPNSLGKILVYTMVPCFNHIVASYFELNFWLDSAKCSIACERYRRKHGELPESLNVLVPEFLETVPNDPFDGKPIRYNKEKKIIYSVGENLVDSGGMGEREIKKIKSLGKRQKARDKEDLVFYLTQENSVSK